MRFNPWKARQDLVADIFLYPRDEGGRSDAIEAGWGCSCLPSRDEVHAGWQGWPLLNSAVLAPGETGCFGWMFEAGEQAAASLRDAATFFLWDDGIIGEARIIG
ncbi:hypothetical protein [Sphingomonas sp. 3-13AW]|jgi:hypothetical protein|uniref:hypothetical protein n=1 Tax=Sphingomonas sp. 3-13AW TaxID=3050450 RepID=UPI003BB7B1C6